MIRRIVVAVGICLLSLSAGAQSFTLQQVLSAPFSSALQAAPVGGRFLWIANQQGKRNIWVAEASGSAYTAHRVTNDDADDGIDVGDITWTPDGEQIVYARGGDFEFPGKEAANPAMLPQGVTEEIWIVGVHGGDARKLAEGQAPAVSPDGATMAYLDKDQIWTLNLRDTAAKPAQLFHGRGGLGSLAWSPDGKWLAFTSGRGDHGFVGVFSFADRTLQYLDPSTEIDREPVWSPDSTQIAFVRIPPDTSGVDFKPRRSAQPWSLRVADVKTGVGHEIWRAHEGPGSVFHDTETEAHQLYWSAGGRIVFPWEGSGWVHLYSVAASGGDATELTPGEFEVDYVAFSKDRKTLVYSSNQSLTDPVDIDRRHLWEVSADSGSPRELTHGDGLEIVPAIGPDGTVAVLRSDVHVPIRPAVVGAGGALKDLAPQLVPADFPGAKLLTPQQVIFSAADGMKIHGQLFVPASAEDGKRHPALVFFHGGSRRQMLLGWHYMDYYSNAYGMNQYLASLGYVVLSVNYRSGIGYGLNFREALNYGAAGASEFNDVQGAGLYLRSRPDVDGAKIGVWGGSYGGYLTALALSRASDMFAAGVDFHGVHDWNLELENWQPKYNPDSDQQAERLAWESSPLSSVKTWRSPVLLIQGDDDRNVQFSQTVRLAAALRAQGTPFEEHVFPDEIHGFLLERSWITAYGLTADFFNRKLKGQ
ncbi:MAG TPA: prolyl oligopeptidase family serine peptidase [Acidobacteriaceae bacterium]|jgi:dipeptidyl aminopeptidase/acylaminoacyl peptidase|nr:prolyl oligopeptidase family serine peptidase [Acidobacteriaceae bacterium]